MAEPGFLVCWAPTHVEVAVANPKAPRRPLVGHARQGRDFAVLFGRLYYGQALLARIAAAAPGEAAGVAPGDEPAIALAAYLAFGTAGLAELEGDFALVVWDAARRRLMGVRDPLGGYPLFWTALDATRAFGTSLRGLLAMRPRNTLDMGYCAAFLAMPAQANEVAGEACAYEGVQRVPPGSLTTLLAEPGRVERCRHWDWGRRVVDPGTADLAELAAGYRTRLEAAVAERMRGTTLAHVSGGMDSTAVALLASRLAGATGHAGAVHAFSLVYDRLPGLRNERTYVEEGLRAAGGIPAHHVVADDILDFDGFHAPPPLDEPYAGLWRLAMDRVSVDAAAQLGASTVLTGLGADEVLDLPPFYLADLAMQGRVARLWAEAGRWAQAKGCSPWTILGHFALRPGTSAWRAGRGLRAWLGPRPRRLQDQDDWTVPPWLAPAFMRRHGLEARLLAHAAQAGALPHGAAMASVLGALASRPGDVMRWSLAAPAGVAVAHPFLDPRLLVYGLGVLTRLPPDPGRMKPLLAEAVRDLLPPAIRERRAKTDFNVVHYMGLARHQQGLEAMVRRAPDVAWEVFDRDAVIRSLRVAALAGADVRALQRLRYSLALIRWLGQEAAGPPKGPRPPVAFRIDLVAS